MLASTATFVAPSAGLAAAIPFTVASVKFVVGFVVSAAATVVKFKTV